MGFKGQGELDGLLAGLGVSVKTCLYIPLFYEARKAGRKRHPNRGQKTKWECNQKSNDKYEEISRESQLFFCLLGNGSMYWSFLFFLALSCCLSLVDAFLWLSLVGVSWCFFLLSHSLGSCVLFCLLSLAHVVLGDGSHGSFCFSGTDGPSGFVVFEVH